MRVIIDSNLTVIEKTDGINYVQDTTCKDWQYCFSVKDNNMQRQCKNFKKLLTGVKLCARK